MLRLFLCLLATLLVIENAYSAPSVPLYFGQPQISLTDHIEYIEDRSGNLTIDKVLDWELSWQKNNHNTLSKGYTNSAYWLKFRVENGTKSTLVRLLEVGNATLDQVDLFVVESGVVKESFSMGDQQPFSTRPIDHHLFLATLKWQPGQTLDLFLRVQSSSAIQVPLNLWEEQSFLTKDATSNLLFGMFFGTMAAIAVYNLLIFFALRDKTYLLYVGYVLSTPLYLAALSGYSYRFLWPDAVVWNGQSVAVFLTLTLVFGIAFTRNFLSLKSNVPLADKALMWLILACIMVAVSAFKIEYQYVVMAGTVCIATVGVVCMLVGLYCWQKKVNTAKIYSLAWLSMVVGGLLMVAAKWSFIPTNELTTNLVYFGCTLEVLLLSFALSARINNERKLRFEAQQSALIASQRTQTDLEHQVAERTKELQKLADKLKHIGNTDQLTNLNNRRRFDEILEEEWAQSLQSGKPIALILLDIDHFKSVNDTYGHPMGDKCLQEVAKLIKEGLRWPEDTAARYGGEEFCVILPNTDYEGALTVAERIRETIAAFPIPNGDTVLKITISLGINSVKPNKMNNTAQLLKRADEALYAAKQQGRNRTVMANSLRAVG